MSPWWLGWVPVQPKRRTLLNAMNKKCEANDFAFSHQICQQLSSHETETSNFYSQSPNYDFAIPHFGTQHILFTFPILERNLFYSHSPFWNATYFIYIPHFGTQPILLWLRQKHFGTPLIWRKPITVQKEFPTNTYRILERNLFYVGLYKTFFRKFVAMFPNVKKNNSTNN